MIKRIHLNLVLTNFTCDLSNSTQCRYLCNIGNRSTECFKIFRPKTISKCNYSHTKSFFQKSERSFCSLSSICRTKQQNFLMCSQYLIDNKRGVTLKPENDRPQIETMSADEKASKFQRPKAQSTIDEQELSHFSAVSSLWWDEGGEFEALHTMNEIRVPFIRDAMMAQKSLDEYRESSPLDGFWILDVGSGGGILSEPLARLGANVVGLDAVEENIKIAQAHLIHDGSLRDKVKYINATVESIAEEQAGKFDVVVASEVVEHVADLDAFVSAMAKLVQPGGSLFFTTLNRTYLSYALGVVAAERILRLVSPGTHDWNKFVKPDDLQTILQRNGCSVRLQQGMFYNPVSKRWSWVKDTSINYAVHAVKDC